MDYDKILQERKVPEKLVKDLTHLVFDQTINELCKFISYVDSFYNEQTGIYPIKGLTYEMILDGTRKYISSQSETYSWGGGDSIDRERVRDIFVRDNGLKYI